MLCDSTRQQHWWKEQEEPITWVHHWGLKENVHSAWLRLIQALSAQKNAALTTAVCVCVITGDVGKWVICCDVLSQTLFFCSVHVTKPGEKHLKALKHVKSGNCGTHWSLCTSASCFHRPSKALSSTVLLPFDVTVWLSSPQTPNCDAGFYTNSCWWFRMKGLSLFHTSLDFQIGTTGIKADKGLPSNYIKASKESVWSSQNRFVMQTLIDGSAVIGSTQLADGRWWGSLWKDGPEHGQFWSDSANQPLMLSR